jgi:isoaspartyl peptidase/L-asparaginase-like protein (Ntn-hydrolase superfamily)
VRAALAEALAAGHRLLSAGGSALDAVVAAVRVLEDCEFLNAGRGSTLNLDGCVEMDAAVMDGSSRSAGAVACLRRVVNPVLAARAVMESSPHVLLCGEGAERFAKQHGLAFADPEFFIVPARRKLLEETLARASSRARSSGTGGTVGAVARDARGHLAAATSTGGLVGKLPGRVSDSALIGAGTFADDATCAVSATGTGDLFIRAGFALEVDALMRHAGLDVAAACERALASVRKLGGRGGCIALDAAGRVAMPFDTAVMARGILTVQGSQVITF